MTPNNPRQEPSKENKSNCEKCLKPFCITGLFPEVCECSNLNAVDDRLQSLQAENDKLKTGVQKALDSLNENEDKDIVVIEILEALTLPKTEKEKI